MKPIRLEIEGFKSLVEKSVLDFQAFYPYGLFLVSGMTGAGKSSLFEAMVYALYGSRAFDHSQIRSNFLDSGQETRVVFTFSQNNQEYTVERTLRLAKNGDLVPNQLLDNGTLVYEKANEIYEQIKMILGLDAKQFQQIVFLPQNQFEELLLASSRDKESIFRDIFKTHSLEGFAKRLVDRAKEAETELNQILSTFDRLVDQDPGKWKDPSIILDRVKRQEYRLAKEHQAFTLAVDELSCRQRHQEALETLDLEKDSLQGKLSSLEEEKKVIDPLVQDLDLYQKAKPLFDLEDKYHTVEKELTKIQCQTTDLLHSQKQAQIKLDQGQKDLEDHQKQSKDMDILRQRCNHLRDLLKQEEMFVAMCQDKDTLQKKKKDIVDRDKAYQIEKDLELIKKEIFNHQQKKNLVLKKDHIKKVMDELYDQQAFLFRQQSQAYAGHLAKDLEEGRACPVCGSTHHPHRALVSLEDPVQKLQEVSKLLAHHQKEMAKLDLALVQLGDLDMDVFLDDLYKKLSQLESDRSLIKVPAQAKDPEQFNALLEQEHQLEGKIAWLQGQGLGTNREALQKDILVMEEQLQAYQDREKKLTDNLILYRQEVAGHQAQQDLLGQLLDQKMSQLNDLKEALAQHQHTIPKKERVRLSLDQVQTYQARIKTYQEERLKLLTLKQNIQDRMEELKRQDYRTYRLDRLGQGLAYGQQKLMHLNQEIALNKRLVGQLTQLEPDYRKASKQVQALKPLADVVSGKDPRSGKISFERYVLSIYLDQILFLANHHLTKMSQGRYQLVKSDEKKQNQLLGLDIDILDGYNGLTRDVKTLSGGETFMASLALALATSEMLAQQSGGHAMETLFIDEGFGSLDQDSLQLAIETLMGLSENRLIGIISHVEALKQRIFPQVVVHKKTSGSDLEVCI